MPKHEDSGNLCQTSLYQLHFKNKTGVERKSKKFQIIKLNKSIDKKETAETVQTEIDFEKLVKQKTMMELIRKEAENSTASLSKEVKINCPTFTNEDQTKNSLGGQSGA